MDHVLEELVASEEGFDEEGKEAVTGWMNALQQLSLSLFPAGRSQDDIRRVYFAIKLNAFNVKKSEGSAAFASGLYPTLALFNHSCDPNCGIQYMPNAKIRLVALRDIAAGEELTIAYTKPYERKSVRQATLKKNFFFTCNCTACQNDVDLGPADASLADVIEHSIDMSEKITAFDSLSVPLVPCANAILELGMTLRGHQQLTSDHALWLLERFTTPDGHLNLVKSHSADGEWEALLFFVDLAESQGRLALRSQLAMNALMILQKLFIEGPPPHIFPYASYLASKI